MGSCKVIQAGLDSWSFCLGLLSTQFTDVCHYHTQDPLVSTVQAPAVGVWTTRRLTILSRQVERSRTKSLDVVLRFICTAFLFDTNKLSRFPLPSQRAVLLFLKGPGERRTGGKWGWGQGGGRCALPTTHFLLLYSHLHIYQWEILWLVEWGFLLLLLCPCLSLRTVHCSFPAELPARGLFSRK